MPKDSGAQKGRQAALVGGLVVLGILVGVIFRELYRGVTAFRRRLELFRTRIDRAVDLGLVLGREEIAAGADAGSCRSAAVGSTPENTPMPGKGYIPAWKVKPPRPDPNAPAPPLPAELPNPQLVRPPMHNPNGVNGDRPPRLVPGIE